MQIIAAQTRKTKAETSAPPCQPLLTGMCIRTSMATIAYVCATYTNPNWQKLHVIKSLWGLACKKQRSASEVQPAAIARPWDQAKSKETPPSKQRQNYTELDKRKLKLMRFMIFRLTGTRRKALRKKAHYPGGDTHQENFQYQNDKREEVKKHERTKILNFINQMEVHMWISWPTCSAMRLAQLICRLTGRSCKIVHREACTYDCEKSAMRPLPFRGAFILASEVHVEYCSSAVSLADRTAPDFCFCSSASYSLLLTLCFLSASLGSLAYRIRNRKAAILHQRHLVPQWSKDVETPSAKLLKRMAPETINIEQQPATSS